MLKNLRNRVGERVNKRNIHLVVLWIIFSTIMLSFLLSYLNIPMYIGRGVEFKNVYRYQYSAYDDEDYLVIKNQTEFEEFWRCNKYPPSPAPEIDFNETMVIAALWGSQPYLGYSLEIERIVRRSDRIVVYVKRSAPGDWPFFSDFPAGTQPAHIVAIEKTDLPISFSIRTLVDVIPRMCCFGGWFLLVNMVLTAAYISERKEQSAEAQGGNPPPPT